MEVYELSSTSIDRHEDTSKRKRRLNDSHDHASSSLPSIPCSIPLTTTRLSKVSKASLARIPCKVCQQLVKTNSRTNFNLVAHLVTKHCDALSDAMDRYSKDSTSISLKGTKLQSKTRDCFEKGFTQTEFQNKLQRWIVGDQQSFLVVGNPYFQQMMLYINKHIIFKSADTVSQTVNRDFEIAKADVYALIKENTSKISFTTDIWTSPDNVAYTAVTAHFIDKNWKLKCILVDFLVFNDSHSGQNIAALFKQIVEPICGDRKLLILGICTDNASNNEVFIQELINSGYLESPECHHRCFAHVLDLAAQDAHQEIKTSIETLREGIKLLQYNGRILKPILDVSTRWNSAFDMLVTYLKMRGPLVQILDQLYMEKKIPDVPSARDWGDLTELVHFFQPFKQATMECSSNKHQTLSYVIPWYNVLLDHCENATQQMHPNAFQMKLDKYFNVSSNHCVIAVVLDPRHKLEFYDDENQDAQENASQKEKIKRQIQSVYAEYDDQSGLMQLELTPTLQLEEYLNTQVVDPRQDPLEWWKHHGLDFPLLAKMARDYLAIPATSASSEHAFSKARHLITDSRTRLSDQTIRASICLGNWQRGRI
ncbi:hypothetical protein BDEG_24966 [Batrachochytrium dendrobatidis JEL423]|uniref:HAT C-terminal dimerisation domain-containing protein n=2 Tax=Batrachochytrium dendrobatidis TaxID=109871 RepID=A0A177WNS6_BATDL|nr:hypothetical protein BDEG_24966 [Batrachochytrium dendrobatidis JEL423]